MLVSRRQPSVAHCVYLARYAGAGAEPSVSRRQPSVARCVSLARYAGAGAAV